MSPRDDVAIVSTGTANLASVLAGFARLGAAPRLTASAHDVREAPRLVLPGVGAFGAAMENLRAAGLTDALRERIGDNRPTLTICLGLQLLCEWSEESPGVAGLGAVPGVVRRFPGDALKATHVSQAGSCGTDNLPAALEPHEECGLEACTTISRLRVPQLGWNEVVPETGCALLTRGFAYYANSYRLCEAPGGWQAAFTEYGGRFVAALEHGPVLACQFHPELSGPWGLALMGRWLEACAAWQAARKGWRC